MKPPSVHHPFFWAIFTTVFCMAIAPSASALSPIQYVIIKNRQQAVRRAPLSRYAKPKPLTQQEHYKRGTEAWKLSNHGLRFVRNIRKGREARQHFRAILNAKKPNPELLGKIGNLMEKRYSQNPRKKVGLQYLEKAIQRGSRDANVYANAAARHYKLYSVVPISCSAVTPAQREHLRLAALRADEGLGLCGGTSAVRGRLLTTLANAFGSGLYPDAEKAAERGLALVANEGTRSCGEQILTSRATYVDYLNPARTMAFLRYNPNFGRLKPETQNKIRTYFSDAAKRDGEYSVAATVHHRLTSALPTAR